MNRLLSEIFFRRLNHFGYGEEKLRADDGNSNSYRYKRDILREIKRWLFFNREWVGVSEPPNNTNSKYYNPDNYGNIAEDFKEATWQLNFLRKLPISFVI